MKKRRSPAVPLIRDLRSGTMTETKSTVPVRVIEETSAYWRIVFDYPPFNIVDATIFEELQELLARMNASPSLRVIVFESANPEFYLARSEERRVGKELRSRACREREILSRQSG